MKPAAKTILIAGCGDIGTRLGLQLAAQGWKVYAVRRNPAALPSRFFSIRADLGDPESLRALPGGADFVLYTATAARFDEAHYRAVYVDGVRNVLAASPSPNFFFVSSSAVGLGRCAGAAGRSAAMAGRSIAHTGRPNNRRRAGPPRRQQEMRQHAD